MQQPEGEERTILSTEAPTLRFENLNLEDGMAQFSAENILQDSLGYMWVATQGGLHRYNGYEFEVYTSTAFDTTSISSGTTFDLEEASNGDLWVTTAGGGLNHFNRKNQTFTHFTHDPSDSTTVASNNLNYVYEATNGDLWVGSPTSGVSRLPADSSDHFIRYQHDPDDPNSITTNFTFRITEDSAGNIWIGSRQGINRINPETGEITRFLDQQEAYQDVPVFVRSQYHPPQSPETVWLASNNGIFKLNSESGKYTRYLPEQEKIELQPLQITDLSPDPDTPGVLWAVGFNTGLIRFDTRTEEYTFYRNDPGDPNSIVNNTATNITADRTGKFWIGHLMDGVSQFTPSSANFFHIRHNPNDSQSLGPDGVWGLYEDQNQTLWAGTGYSADYYLNRINLRNGQVTRYQHDPDNPNTISRLNAHAITEDRSGNLWVGTVRGLNLFDRQSGEATRFQRKPFETNLPSNFVNSILPDIESDNKLWIGTFNGLKQFDINNGSYSDVHIQSEDINNPTVLDLIYDSEQRLWVATIDGLILVDPKDGQHTIFRNNPKDSTTLSSNSISVIMQRNNEPNILWVGTQGSGLNRFDIASGEVTHFTTDDGLANNVIYGILEDERGTLWISTNHGISNFNPDNDSFRNYGLEDGLIQLEHNQFAYAKGNNGILYFGHIDGITAFNPENLLTNTTPPQVVISDFRLFNETVLPGPDAPFDEQIEKENEITITHEQSEVAFEYAGLHYSNPAKNRYKYQLVGFDKQWVDAENRRIATYTNLAPGDYTFRVQASNADGVWNTEGASVTLTVLPPWYRTWWAYGLYALALGGIIFGVDRFQRRRLTKKERERAALREAELRAEAENKRRADTEQLSQIGRAITSSLSVNKIIDTVYKNVNDLMDATVFGVGIYNEDEEQLEFPATKEKGEKLPTYVNGLHEENRLAVWCFKNQEEILIGDYQNEYSKYIKRHKTPVQGEDPISIIYLPLVHQEKAVGVITTQSFEKNAYTPYHLNLLRNLATYAAIALDNAAAYRQLNITLKDLKDAQGQLVQQEKLASLGQLTAGIAHEIKNPLNFVNNFSDLSVELIQEARNEVKSVRAFDGTSPQNEGFDEIEYLLKDVETNLRKIHEHGSRADSIVKSMLQHSRGGDGKMEPTDLNALIKEYVNLAFHGMRASKNPLNVDIELQLDGDIGEIDLITEDFSRVILNLCNNAFDAMREKLTADSRQLSENPDQNYKPKLTVKTYRKNSNIIIDIEDNGPGIPKDLKAKILQPFFTTKKGTQGTGLGLSITNDIINAHGGQIDIESEPGSTCFTITLPK